MLTVGIISAEGSERFNEESSGVVQPGLPSGGTSKRISNEHNLFSGAKMQGCPSFTWKVKGAADGAKEMLRNIIYE